MVAFYEEKKISLAFGSFVEPELSTAPVPQAENNGYSEAWFNSSKLVWCSHLIQKKWYSEICKGDLLALWPLMTLFFTIKSVVFKSAECNCMW